MLEEGWPHRAATAPCRTGRRRAAHSRKPPALPDPPPGDRLAEASRGRSCRRLGVCRPHRRARIETGRVIENGRSAWGGACCPGPLRRPGPARDRRCPATVRARRRPARPSAENRRASTIPLCFSVIRSSPVATSQMTTLLSAQPEANVLPSGEKARLQTKRRVFLHDQGLYRVRECPAAKDRSRRFLADRQHAAVRRKGHAMSHRAADGPLAPSPQVDKVYRAGRRGQLPPKGCRRPACCRPAKKPG